MSESLPLTEQAERRKIAERLLELAQIGIALSRGQRADLEWGAQALAAAADRIEELERALAPFAALVDILDDACWDDDEALNVVSHEGIGATWCGPADLNAADVRRAARVLSASSVEQEN